MTHTVALSVFPKKNQLAPGPNSSKYGIQFYQTFRNVMKMYLCTLINVGCHSKDFLLKTHFVDQSSFLE